MTEKPYEFVPVDGGKPIFAWTKGVPVGERAWDQMRDVARLPFVFHHVAAMPDVHWGLGATVGSVIPTRAAVVPAAVGVDIGCGMFACRLAPEFTADHLPDSLAKMRSSLEAAVPHGRTDNGGPNDVGSWPEGKMPKVAQEEFADLAADLRGNVVNDAPSLGKAVDRAARHMGTLGTGNHFLEVCLDEENRIWIMLHSGSRGIGNAIGQHYIREAKKEMKKWFVPLPNPDLAYLPQASPLYGCYIRAMNWAQRYAWRNRVAMMRNSLAVVLHSLGGGLPVETAVDKSVHCAHNYTASETHYGERVWVTRKGAVRARRGEQGIIPGSMGARSFIVEGKGNPDSFCSCSHGAGRAMSRTEAKKRFTVEDHEKATAGVECRKDAGVLDETPAAYKDVDAVMAAQADLVEVVHTLRQIVCVKG